MPKSSDDSWDGYFEKASMLRHELESEVFDAFDIENVKKFLMWYKDADINDTGMCGQVRCMTSMSFFALYTIKRTANDLSDVC